MAFAETVETVTGWQPRRDGGKLYAWAGQLAGAFGKATGDDAEIAGALFREFWEYATGADYGSGKLVDFLTTRNVNDHAPKWVKAGRRRRESDGEFGAFVQT